MKKNVLKLMSVFLMFAMIAITSCKKDTETAKPSTGIVPEKMTIDIPSSLSMAPEKKGTDSITPINGNDIYSNLRTFIWVGAAGAHILDGLLQAVHKHNITSIQKVVLTGEDGFTKTLEVKSNVAFDNKTYEWGMFIYDQDDSKALELFWNTNPVRAIAIYQASKLNHKDWFSIVHQNAIVQVEYSKADGIYEEQMIVSISGLHLIQRNDINNLKMKVGKNGNILEVIGNSNHPTCILFDQNQKGGRNWAFVARSNETANVSVAKIALPLCSYDKNDASLWQDFSIYNVLYNEIQSVYNNQAPDDVLKEFLKNAVAPGYFEGTKGFVACGSNVPANPAFTSDFINLDALSPYVPAYINQLKLAFAKK